MVTGSLVHALHLARALLEDTGEGTAAPCLGAVDLDGLRNVDEEDEKHEASDGDVHVHVWRGCLHTNRVTGL